MDSAFAENDKESMIRGNDDGRDALEGQGCQFRISCLICGKVSTGAAETCDNINETNKSTESASGLLEQKMGNEDIGNGNNKELFRGLLRRCQVDLTWSAIMLTKKKKKGDDSNDSEFVPSFCDTCKEQLQALLQLERQIEELGKMLERETELIKQKLKDSEGLFQAEKLYHGNEKYFRVRRKILGARITSSKQSCKSEQLRYPLETNNDLETLSMSSTVRRSKRTVKPKTYAEEQLFQWDKISDEDHEDASTIEAECIIKEEPDSNTIEEPWEGVDMDYCPAESPPESHVSTGSADLSDFESGTERSHEPKRVKRCPKARTRHETRTAEDDSLNRHLSPASTGDNETTQKVTVPPGNSDLSTKPRRGPRGSYKKNDKVHVDPTTGHCQYLQVKFEKLAEDKFKCMECQEIVNNESTMKKHTMRSHTDQFVCTICGQHKACNSDLNKHIREVHEGLSRKMLTKNRECPICGKPFGHKAHLDAHTITHYSEQDKQDAIAKGLVIRIRPRNHQCGVCGVIFNNVTWLKRHEKIKHPKTEDDIHETQRICPECGKSFSLAYYKQHMERYHSGLDDTTAKPFQCSVCDKRFYNHHCLAEHKRTHTGERPFKCLLCDKDFTSKRRLKLHNMQHHESTKPFSCTSCSASFITSYKLRRHVATVHERKKQKNWNGNAMSGNWETDPQTEIKPEELMDNVDNYFL